MRARVERQATHHQHRLVEHAEADAVEHVPSKEDLKQGLDELLDEIDDVLEENAEEFVSGYVQKAGE